MTTKDGNSNKNKEMHQTKRLYSSKEAINKREIKRQPMEWGRIFETYVPTKDYYLKYIKNTYKIKKKPT